MVQLPLARCKQQVSTCLGQDSLSHCIEADELMLMLQRDAVARDTSIHPMAENAVHLATTRQCQTQLEATPPRHLHQSTHPLVRCMQYTEHGSCSLLHPSGTCTCKAALGLLLPAGIVGSCSLNTGSKASSLHSTFSCLGLSSLHAA